MQVVVLLYLLAYSYFYINS